MSRSVQSCTGKGDRVWLQSWVWILTGGVCMGSVTAFSRVQPFKQKDVVAAQGSLGDNEFPLVSSPWCFLCVDNASERWPEAFHGTWEKDTCLSTDQCWLTPLPVQSSLKAEQPLWSLWWLRRSLHKQIRAAAMQCCGCPSRSRSTMCQVVGSVILLLSAISLVCSCRLYSSSLSFPCFLLSERLKYSLDLCLAVAGQTWLHGCFCEALLSWHLCLMLVLLLSSSCSVCVLWDCMSIYCSQKQSKESYHPQVLLRCLCFRL